MTLSFKTKINGKPTYFVEKIWKAFKDKEITNELIDATFEHNFKWDLFGQLNPKIHTIREDKHNRWKAGNKIHFVINNRTPHRFQFMPVVACISVQKIEINYNCSEKIDVDCNNHYFFIKNKIEYDVMVFIDKKRQSLENIKTLVSNDGFESIDDFFDFFNKDFIGKIIHWTEFKY